MVMARRRARCTVTPCSDTQCRAAAGRGVTDRIVLVGDDAVLVLQCLGRAICPAVSTSCTLRATNDASQNVG